VCRRRKAEKGVVGCDMERVEDAGDWVKWKLRTRVADPKQLGEMAKGKNKKNF